MDLKLRVVEGKNAGQDIPVPGKKFFIGRAEDCHLRPGSDMVSRHHCVLMVEESYVALRDFGSKNGTYVNGERVSGEIELKAGDRLKVGPLEFELQVAHGIKGKKRPPVSDLKEAAARTAQDADSGEVDVSQWLMGDAPAANPAQETQRVRMSDTDEIKMGSTQALPQPQIPLPAQPADDDSKAEPAKKGMFAKKTFGKLPTQPKKDESKDSRDAATRMLEQFRKKR